MPTNKQRYTITVSDEMYQAIEDFRFENRFNTKSDATSELIRLGLESINKRKKNGGKNLLREK